MSNPCQLCPQKQFLINKYCKLIKLLNTKYNKTTKSLIKQQTLPSQTLLETTESDHNKLASVTSRISDTLYLGSEFNGTEYQVPSSKNNMLALLVIVNKSKKALLKCSFQSLRSAAKIQQVKETDKKHQANISFDLSPSIASIIDQTLSYGKKFHPSPIPNSINLKQLNNKLFYLQLQNSQYKKRISLLQNHLQQSQKRFYKQTQKKRQSLETVAEEIRQKTQYIVELQLTIKKYQKALGKTQGQFSMENVLIEDQQQMKKTCLRLENINQKLNSDLRVTAGTIDRLNKQIQEIKVQNSKLKQQNKQLKEHNFDILQQLAKNKQIGNVYRGLCQKFNKKLKVFKIQENNLVRSMRLSAANTHNSINNNLVSNNNKQRLCNSGDNIIMMTKNTQISQQELTPLSRKTSIRELEIEQKLEEIFSFLFSIQNQEYKIINQELFDEDQLKLLKSHKNLFLSNMQNRQNAIPNAMKTQKLLKQNSVDQTDSIYYIQSPNRAHQQNSFFNALQPQLAKPKQSPHQSSDLSNPATSNKNSYLMPQQTNQNMKIIDLQIQKSKLIQKISQLKNLHMHIRNVILNFLKSLNLQQNNNNRNDYDNIMEIIFQFFEYSEDEKACIFKEKKKKFWGIL